MWSISRSKINKKVGGDSYVPFWRLFQKALPILRRNRIAFPPASYCLNIDASIISQKAGFRPRAHDLCERIHGWMNYGRYAQLCQILVGCYAQYLNGVAVGQYVP